MRVSSFLRGCSIILLSVVFSTGWANAVPLKLPVPGATNNTTTNNTTTNNTTFTPTPVNRNNIWGAVQLDDLLFNTINPYQSDTNTPENTTAAQAQYLQDVISAENNGAGITQSATTIVEGAVAGTLLNNNSTTGGGVTTGVTTGVVNNTINGVTSSGTSTLSTFGGFLGTVLIPGSTSTAGTVDNTAVNVGTTILNTWF